MDLPNNLTSRDVQVRGRRVHYLASAAPPEGVRPVVLVHGIGLSHRYLTPLAAAMADEAPVFVPDLPGFGESYKPWRVESLDELAEWLADYLRALELAPAGLLGQSFGCQIVIRVAAQWPELAASAVFQGVTVDPQARSLVQQFLRWRRNQRVEKNTKKASPSPLPDYWRCGLRRIIWTYHKAVEDRPEQLAPRMECPTLVVHGLRDPIVSADWARQIAELLPHGRLITVEGVSHTINLEAPDQLAQITLPHLIGADPSVSAHLAAGAVRRGPVERG